MFFEIIGRIDDVKTIATGRSIRDIDRLRRQYGSGRWRKLKGVATVRLSDGRIRKAELVPSPRHWQKEIQDQTIFGIIWNEETP